jgi:glycosyltransferase involved in cell wall biosynthesis
LEVVRCGTIGGGHRSFTWRAIGFLWFTATSLVAGLRIGRVDVIWGTSPPLLQVASAWALARLKRVPLVFEVRDLWPAFAVAAGVLRSRILVALSEWLERFLYRRADQLVVNSPGFTEHLVQRGAAAERISLIPNGVDPTMFDPAADGAALRQSYGLSGKFVALYAGAHGMSNDLGVVLAAAEQLRDDPRVTFLLVGDGKEKANWWSKPAAGLTNIKFVPPVKRRDPRGAGRRRLRHRHS